VLASALSFVVLFSVLAAVFMGLERMLSRPAPASAPRSFFRPGTATDLGWLIVGNLSRRIVRPLVAGMVALPFVLIRGGGGEALLAGHGPLTLQPVWFQTLEMLLFADLVGYWVHRGLQHGRAWTLHRIHHSSTSLDWLSAVRSHPLDTAVTTAVQTAAILLVGFPPMLLVPVAGLIGLHGILVHANVTWRYGFLGHVLVSPSYHRWHHAEPVTEGGCNFAGIFPLWDHAFGTFHLPESAPTTFGAGEEIPARLLPQLLLPFRSGG